VRPHSHRASPVPVCGAAEGLADQAVLRRLSLLSGLLPTAVYGGYGKAYLRDRIRGYNAAARHASWFVLVDLNDDFECPPKLLQSWLPHPAPAMCLRVAVRKVEAWLLADGKAIAAFLGVPPSRAPQDPDSLANPKREMVDLARRSRRRRIRDDMVPRPTSGRVVGDNYTARIIEFVTTLWRPERAATRSPSLERCLRALCLLARTAHGSPCSPQPH